MARGFRGGFRGGGGRRGIGGGRRGSSRSSSSSKGRVRGGKAVQYALKTRRGKGETTYYGTTNNPRRRAAEHRKSGKLGKGDRLVVETKAIPRKSAERMEGSKLASYRRQKGRNPKHNSTRDGRYHNPR